jgi:hypothetical protein
MRRDHTLIIIAGSVICTIALRLSVKTFFLNTQLIFMKSNRLERIDYCLHVV